MVEPVKGSNFNENSAGETQDVVHAIESSVLGWEGTKLLEDSVVVGLNVAGSAEPIFWVFQRYEEFTALAEHLGPDQPLYGMRSCLDIIAVKDYTSQRLSDLVDRYILEIRALSKESIIIGGNCQGSMLALFIAQKLAAMKKTPKLLILMEWSFSLGVYNSPVLILYGEKSYTAKLYIGSESATQGWRTDFPEHLLTSIPGTHGQFFQGSNIVGLASKLLEYTSL